MTKSDEQGRIAWTGDAIEDGMVGGGAVGGGAVGDRREFLEALVVGVLCLPVLPWLAHASEPSPPNGSAIDDDVSIRSTPGLFDHVHDLVVPRSLLVAPPREGVVLTSTRSFLHVHEIALTRDQLALVGRGGTVIEPASSHRFVIARKGRGA